MIKDQIEAGEKYLTDITNATFDYAQKSAAIQNKYLSAYAETVDYYSALAEAFKTWNTYSASALEIAKAFYTQKTA